VKPGLHKRLGAVNPPALAALFVAHEFSAGGAQISQPK